MMAEGNVLEDRVFQALEFTSTCRRNIVDSGWPDFLVHNPITHFVFGVEVKSETDKVREKQKENHKILEVAGIPVIVFRTSKNEDYDIMEKRLLDQIDDAYSRWYNG